jgi:ornithine cyclodeaminase
MSPVRGSDDTRIRFVGGGDVARICDQLDVVDLVREAFRLHGCGDTVLPDEAYLEWKHQGEVLRSINMPSYLGGSLRSAGTKVINSNPANPRRGLARASGLTVLFDVATGRPTAVLAAAGVSALRTAAVSALSVELLRAGPVRRLALLGAGRIGREHLRLFERVLPEIGRATVFDVEPSQGRALADELTSSGSRLAFEQADEAKTAVRDADVVIATTTTQRAYLELDWFRPGTVVLNVSLDDVSADMFMRAGTLVVDDWGLVAADRRRLLGRLAVEGRIAGPRSPERSGVRRVDAEVAELVLGTAPGRRSADDVVVVNPFGMSIHDVAVATEVARRAAAEGLGTLLEP